MNSKENYQIFNVKCLNANNIVIEATVGVWTGKEYCPTVCEFPTNEPYTYSGEVIMYYFEYLDRDGIVINTKSDRINNIFYGLCLELEKINTKMLVKGCSYGYYMIPRLHHSLHVVKLNLGERIDLNFSRINIFSPEPDVALLRTPKELVAYYYKWAESIAQVH